MATKAAQSTGVHDAPRFFRWASDLVARHSRYSTRSLVETQTHLHGLHESIALDVEDADAFVGYDEVAMTLGSMMLTVGCINAQRGYELRFRTGDEYLITIPLRGSGWASTGDLFVEYGHGDVMIVAPSCSVVKHWDGPGEVISLHVPADRFAAAVADGRRNLVLDAPFISIGQRRLLSFLRVVDALCADLLDAPQSSPFTRAPLADRMEDLLIALLVEEIAPAESDARGGCAVSPAIPYYIRRAEEFIASNAHRDISIAEIAGMAGVSLRTIQYGFRRFRATTPMLHLKRVRYDRARALLLSGEASHRRIGDVAAEIGCANVSQFSRDYRSLFGESPSQTLAAPRRMIG